MTVSFQTDVNVPLTCLFLSLQITENSQTEGKREGKGWRKSNEVKRDVREGCSERVCSLRRSNLAKDPLPAPSTRKRNKRGKKNTKELMFCFFSFLHHFAFPLRHIEVLTSRAERGATCRDPKPQLTSRVIALKMKLHLCVCARVCVKSWFIKEHMREDTEVTVKNQKTE